MAVILNDPNSAGPFPTFQVKDVQVRVIALPYTVFKNGSNTDTLVAAFAADATILRVDTWVRTALTTATAPTVALGTASGGTQIAAAFSVTNTVGTMQTVSPATGIVQTYNIPYSNDIRLYARTTCSTGDAAAGEIDLIVYFVR